MGIKRWLVVVFIGELSLALGGALALRRLYRATRVRSVPGDDLPRHAPVPPYIARGIILGARPRSFLAGHPSSRRS
jgi:hypothetical protein